MRTLFATPSSGEDRIYEVVAMLFLQYSVRKETGPDMRIVRWELDKLLKAHPWKDFQKQMRRTSDSFDHRKTIDVSTNFWFTLDKDERTFRTEGTLLPLRRGQMLPFENWTEELARELFQVGIPNLGGVQARVIFTRIFPEARIAR